jgi:hypothetical protein
MDQRLPAVFQAGEMLLNILFINSSPALKTAGKS